MVRVLFKKLHPCSSQSTPLALRKAARATLILVPLFGLHNILLPFRPEAGDSMDKFYQFLSALLVSLQVIQNQSNHNQESHSFCVQFTSRAFYACLWAHSKLIVYDCGFHFSLCCVLIYFIFTYLDFDVNAREINSWPQSHPSPKAI